MGERWQAKNQEQFHFFCAHILKNWDFSKPLQIEWKEGELRTTYQNRYIHPLFRDIAKQGCKRNKIDFKEDHAEEVKEFFKNRFGYTTSFYSLIKKQDETRLKSTSDYTKGEMSEFIEKIHAWCAEAGIVVDFDRHKSAMGL